MNCPTCKNKDLSNNIKIGDVELTQCANCRGIWFDKDELRKVKDQKLPDENWFDVDLWKEKSKFGGAEGEKFCPVCGLFLWELNYGVSSIQIDVCKKCEGIWLDRGEYKKILKYIRDRSGYEVLHNYLQNLIEEGKEIFIGSETLRSETLDFLTLLKLFQYKFLVQHPILSEILNNFPK